MGVVILSRKNSIQGPSADFEGSLNDRGLRKDDKFMHAVSTQTTIPHRHPEADLCYSGMPKNWPKDLDVGCSSKHTGYNKSSS